MRAAPKRFDPHKLKVRKKYRSHWGADQTRAARIAIEKRDGPNCWLCGGEFGFKELPTLDHVIPLSLGGRHHISNLKLSHRRCNTMRGNKPPPRELRGQ